MYIVGQIRRKTHYSSLFNNLAAHLEVVRGMVVEDHWPKLITSSMIPIRGRPLQLINCIARVRCSINLWNPLLQGWPTFWQVGQIQDKNSLEQGFPTWGTQAVAYQWYLGYICISGGTQLMLGGGGDAEAKRLRTPGLEGQSLAQRDFGGPIF